MEKVKYQERSEVVAGVNIFLHYMSEHDKISRKNSTHIKALSIERSEVSVTFSKLIPQSLASTLAGVGAGEGDASLANILF